MAFEQPVAKLPGYSDKSELRHKNGIFGQPSDNPFDHYHTRYASSHKFDYAPAGYHTGVKPQPRRSGFVSNHIQTVRTTGTGHPSEEPNGYEELVGRTSYEGHYNESVVQPSLTPPPPAHMVQRNTERHLGITTGYARNQKYLPPDPNAGLARESHYTESMAGPKTAGGAHRGIAPPPGEAPEVYRTGHITGHVRNNVETTHGRDPNRMWRDTSYTKMNRSVLMRIGHVPPELVRAKEHTGYTRADEGKIKGVKRGDAGEENAEPEEGLVELELSRLRTRDPTEHTAYITDAPTWTTTYNLLHRAQGPPQRGAAPLPARSLSAGGPRPVREHAGGRDVFNRTAGGTGYVSNRAPTGLARDPPFAHTRHHAMRAIGVFEPTVDNDGEINDFGDNYRTSSRVHADPGPVGPAPPPHQVRPGVLVTSYARETKLHGGHALVTADADPLYLGEGEAIYDRETYLEPPARKMDREEQKAVTRGVLPRHQTRSALAAAAAGSLSTSSLVSAVSPDKPPIGSVDRGRYFMHPTVDKIMGLDDRLLKLKNHGEGATRSPIRATSAPSAATGAPAPYGAPFEASQTIGFEQTVPSYGIPQPSYA